MTDIFTRIREAHAGQPTSGDLSRMLREIIIALADEREFRSQHEAAAVNPLVETGEAERAQDAIAKSHLAEQRLEAGRKLIESKLAETQEAEKQAALALEYEAAKAERDAVVAEFRKVWGKHCPPLVVALRKVLAVDEKVEGLVTPTGRDPLMPTQTVLNVDPTRALAAHVRLPKVSDVDAPGWNYEAEAARRKADEEQRVQWAFADAQAKAAKDAGNMKRYGTTDDLELARRRREEAERQRELVDKRNRFGARAAQ